MTGAEFLTAAAGLAALLCYAGGAAVLWYGYRMAGWLFWLAGVLFSLFAVSIGGTVPIP